MTLQSYSPQVTRFHEAMQGLLHDLGMACPELLSAHAGYKLGIDDKFDIWVSLDERGVVTFNARVTELPPDVGEKTLRALLRHNQIDPKEPSLVIALDDTDHGIWMWRQESLDNLRKETLLRLFNDFSDGVEALRQRIDMRLI